MIFITDTDFCGLLNISGTDNPATKEKLFDIAEQIQIKELDLILGYQLAKDFISGLSIIPEVQKWLDLRDGKEFVYNGCVCRFKGMNEIFKYLTYYQWVKENENQLTAQGNLQASTPNGFNHSNPRAKLVWAYNEAVKQIIECQKLIEIENEVLADTYAGFSPSNYSFINLFDI